MRYRVTIFNGIDLPHSLYCKVYNHKNLCFFKNSKQKQVKVALTGYGLFSVTHKYSHLGHGMCRGANWQGKRWPILRGMRTLQAGGTIHLVKSHETIPYKKYTNLIVPYKGLYGWGEGGAST